MRLQLIFSSKEQLVLPINYNNIIQAVILRNLSPKLSDFFHNEGYQFNNRKFKLYTFSNLYGKNTIKRLQNRNYITILFHDDVTILVSSIIPDFTMSLSSSLLKKGKLTILNNDYKIKFIKLLPEPKIENSIKIKMLSPVTVYSTYLNQNRKRTHYYNPTEQDFSSLIEKNLIEKYAAFYGESMVSRHFSIKPLTPPKKVLKIYKNFIIESYLGRFLLNGNKKLLRIAYDTGIGAKNSQGFGCFELLHNNIY